MKKPIYSGLVRYKIRKVRYVKGVRKPNKSWSEGDYETCFTSKDINELNKDKYLIDNICLKHKTKNELEVVVTAIEDVIYLGMSNDVY